MESIINKYRQMEVPIERIKPSKWNTYDPTEIQELAENIESIGLIHALCLCEPDEEGFYEILAGERRYRAIVYAREKNPLFYSKVPCIVIQNDISDACKQLIIEISNLEQREFDKVKHRMRLVELVQQSMKDENLSRRQAIEMLSKHMKSSPRYSDMYLTIAQRGNQEIKDLFESGKVPAHIASNASNLDEEHQRDFVERVQNGIPPKTAIQEIYKETRNPVESSITTPSFSPTITVEDEISNYIPDKTDSTANRININHHNSDHKKKDKPSAAPKYDEPQYTDAEIFAINNPGFDDIDDDDDYFDDSGFAYTPLADRSKQAADVDTTRRFGTVQKSKIDANATDEEIEKLQNNVRRELEIIKRTIANIPGTNIDPFLIYISDWLDEVKAME